MRRSWRGELWHEAHREHLCQRWPRTGVRHSTVTGWLGVGAVATTGLALVAWWAGAALWYWAALLIGAGIVASEMVFVTRLEHRAPSGR